MMNRYCNLASSLFTLTLFLMGSSVHAASAAAAGIEVNGRYIGGYTATWDGQTRGDLVRQLAKRPITFERDYKMVVDAKKPAVALLEGRIHLVSELRGEREIMAKPKGLELVERDGKWFVDSGSLERALDAEEKPGVGSPKGKPGGYTLVPVTNKEVIAAAEFCVGAQAKRMGGKPPVELKLVKLLSAEQQVVSGMNYRLKLKVEKDGSEIEAEAVVWWQAWRKPDPYRLTSWKWKEEGGPE